MKICDKCGNKLPNELSNTKQVGRVDMTLDEIISNAEFCANEYKKFSEIAPERSLTFKKYEEDHRQLAEWLKDYKRLKEQEPSENWHDTPSSEMTLEQARQAVRELRKYVMDNHILSKSKDMISRQVVKDKYKERLINNLTDNDRGIDLSKYAEEPYKAFCKFIDSIPPVTPQPQEWREIESE